MPVKLLNRPVATIPSHNHFIFRLSRWLNDVNFICACLHPNKYICNISEFLLPLHFHALEDCLCITTSHSPRLFSKPGRRNHRSLSLFPIAPAWQIPNLLKFKLLRSVFVQHENARIIGCTISEDLLGAEVNQLLQKASACNYRPDGFPGGSRHEFMRHNQADSARRSNKTK